MAKKELTNATLCAMMGVVCALLMGVALAGAPESKDMLVYVSENIPRYILLSPSVKMVEIGFKIPEHAMSFGNSSAQYVVENNDEGLPETLVDNTTQAALYFVLQQWVNTSGTQEDKEKNDRMDTGKSPGENPSCGKP